MSAIMNGMTNKERKRKIELLKQYTDIEKSIQDLKDRYEELYTASTKITPSYSETSGFGGGFDGSKVENNCIKLLEISQKIDRAEERLREINTALMKLNYSQRKLVEYVAIECHTIGQATRFFGRTYSNTKVSFNTAITKMDI